MGGTARPPEYEKLVVKGKRHDGRKLDEMRPVKMEVGVVKRADGSAYLEIGKTRVLAAVYGPREAHPRKKMKEDRAILKVRYCMVPFSTSDRVRPGRNRRSMEISKVAGHALEPAIFLEEYPQMAIELELSIIQADAGTRCAAITAGSLALAHAGIPMRGLVSACATGKIDSHLAMDLSGPEDNFGEADLPIATLSSTGGITLMQLDGEMTKEELKKAIGMCRKGNELLTELQRKALLAPYKR